MDAAPCTFDIKAVAWLYHLELYHHELYNTTKDYFVDFFECDVGGQGKNREYRRAKAAVR